MLPNRRQAIIWSNADLIQSRIYAALGGDDLMLRHLPVFLMDHFYNVFLSSGLPPCLHSFPGQLTLWHDNGFQSNIKALYMICKTHWEQWNEELGFVFHLIQCMLGLEQNVWHVLLHEDVMTWKCFPRYWPFVTGILTCQAFYNDTWMYLTHLPWTKWLPLCRRYFQMHFSEWKDLYLNWNFTEVCS